MSVRKIFPSQIYYANLAPKATTQKINNDLVDECYRIAEIDEAGQIWSEKNYPGGYTSYSSLSKLFQFSTTFDLLRKRIDKHVLAFAKSLDMDTKNHKLEMTEFWINIVPTHTYHGLHIHPLSTISGTYYVQVPPKAGEIKFEDPRLERFMCSLPRKLNARPDNQRHIYVKPEPGKVILFESWMHHEVMQNLDKNDRVSVSFNYNWF